DALAVYRHATLRLREELGLEVNDSLKELERRILTHDSAIAAPRTSGTRRLVRSTRLGVAATAALVLGAAGVGLGLRVTTSSGASLKSLKPSIVLLDGGTGRVIAAWPYSSYRFPWVTTGNGAFWLASFTNGFTEFDPRTGRILRRVLPPFGNGTNLAL